MSAYKEIAVRSEEKGILAPAEAALLREVAGYRNRMIHFYHEVSDEEIFELAATRLGDLERLATAYRGWLEAHPERLDEKL